MAPAAAKVAGVITVIALLAALLISDTSQLSWPRGSSTCQTVLIEDRDPLVRWLPVPVSPVEDVGNVSRLLYDAARRLFEVPCAHVRRRFGVRMPEASVKFLGPTARVKAWLRDEVLQATEHGLLFGVLGASSSQNMWEYDDINYLKKLRNWLRTSFPPAARTVQAGAAGGTQTRVRTRACTIVHKCSRALAFARNRGRGFARALIGDCHGADVARREWKKTRARR